MVKRKNLQPLTFDWEGFWLASGIGTVCLGMSALFFWLVMDGIPEGQSRSSIRGYSQLAARMLPAKVKGWILLIMAALFGLFGLLCLGMGIYTAIRHFINRTAS